MSKNAMAGAITLCGVGLCAIGGGLMMQSGSAAHVVLMPLAATAAIAALKAAAEKLLGKQDFSTDKCFSASLPFRTVGHQTQG